MKNIFGIGILLTYIAFPSWGQTSKYQNKQIALINYNISIDAPLMDKFQSHAEAFPRTRTGNGDRIIARIKEYSYALFEEQLEREVGLELLPLNTFGKKFNYDEYGFPDVSINKALRKGQAKYFMKVELSITQADEEQRKALLPAIDTTAEAAAIIQANLLIPIVEYRITLYSNKGILPIDKFSSQVSTSEVIEITEAYFNGLTSAPFSEGDASLAGLIEMAIARLTRNLNS